jgi:Protein of unknown function (DUF1569)
MNRRKFLTTSAISAAGLTVVGAAWLNSPSGDANLSLDSTLAQLKTMTGKALRGSGQWTPAHVFNHNAQSIDFSMTGFPQAKSALFQSTVGAAAFSVFAAKREMRHNLAEAIPGAPDIPNNNETDAAIARLIDSIQRFQVFSGALQPHFAYGQLSKPQYELAHAMHFQNHMSEISIG